MCYNNDEVINMNDKENKKRVDRYTGLTDKNGTKIYENDLISCNKHKNIAVFFEDGSFRVKYRKSPVTNIICSLESFLRKYRCKVTNDKKIR